MTVGHSEAEPFWVEFLRSLARRGLRGVKLVTSDAHEGLKAAIAKVLGLAALPRALHAQRLGLRRQDPAPHRPGVERPRPCPGHRAPRAQAMPRHPPTTP